MEHPEIAIRKVWDEDPLRGKAWSKELGVPFESGLENIWSDPEIDAVIVTSSTAMHKDLMMAAAKHGKHIFAEKVLAPNLKDCAEIFSAVESNGVHLMVSLPRLRESFYLYAQDVVDRGVLGQITLVRCRVAHDGSIASQAHPKGWLPERFYNPDEAGGGALIDLGAHPIYLTNRLAGPADRVSASLTSFCGRPVDDHAVVTVNYKNGATGLIETSFVSGTDLFLLEIHGTEGVLMVENYHHLKMSLKNGEWTIPEKLPAPLPTPMEQWIDAIQKGKKPTITKEDALRLTEINEKAALSHALGKPVRV